MLCRRPIKLSIGSQARLSEIEALLVESEELVSAREAVEERRKVVEELRSHLSDAETTVEDVRAKAAEVESKLYGGKVTNPKELSDLDADLRSIKHLIANREDTLLALLVEIDEADRQLKAANSAYAEIEGGWNQEQGELLGEKAQIEPEVASLQARTGAAGVSCRQPFDGALSAPSRPPRRPRRRQARKGHVSGVSHHSPDVASCRRPGAESGSFNASVASASCW